MDPLSVVALSASVGGAAGKFVEKAWDSGEKWISSFYNNHREKAMEQAKNNSLDFLNELAERVKILEENNMAKKEEIEEAQNHPNFSVLLQKALLTSSQTDNKEKHILLARLVSERLTASPEGVLSLASKMACDAISFANTRQLQILGLLVTLFDLRPRDYSMDGMTKEQFNNMFKVWLLKRLEPYKQMNIKGIDMLHLESLSCLKWDTIITRDLQEILSAPNHSTYIFDIKDFKNSQIGNKIYYLWENRKLKCATLTSVGKLLGVYVSDLLTDDKTVINGWD